MRHFTRTIWQPPEQLCMFGPGLSLNGAIVRRTALAARASGPYFGFAHAKRILVRNEQETFPCKP
jgi:hypothetical protein